MADGAEANEYRKDESYSEIIRKYFGKIREFDRKEPYAIPLGTSFIGRDLFLFHWWQS